MPLVASENSNTRNYTVHIYFITTLLNRNQNTRNYTVHIYFITTLLEDFTEIKLENEKNLATFSSYLNQNFGRN